VEEDGRISSSTDRCAAWVEIDSESLQHNLLQVRKLVSGSVRIMAVAKADAYGHGAIEASKLLVSAGAEALAVTRLEEALELRRAGVSSPIMVFDSTLPSYAADVVKAGLEQTVCTSELAKALSRAARDQNRQVEVHVKIDTGMGRLGVLPQDAVDFVRMLSELPNIKIAGTYTHFATALERDLTATRLQLRRFTDVVESLKSAGLPVGLVHAANSAAMIRLPESRFDMVRPGTVLYGQYPSRFVPRAVDLKETWQLKTRISFLKGLPKGYAVGYGAEYTTHRETVIAVLPIGYADGMTMAPESVIRRQMGLTRRFISLLRPQPRQSVTIRGTKVPVVGRVAMQMCTIDVTDVTGVEIGDEVLVPVRRIATSPRIPRVYIQNG
jgi:alanine racemase